MTLFLVATAAAGSDWGKYTPESLKRARKKAEDAQTSGRDIQTRAKAGPLNEVRNRAPASLSKEKLQGAVEEKIKVPKVIENAEGGLNGGWAR